MPNYTGLAPRELDNELGAPLEFLRFNFPRAELLDAAEALLLSSSSSVQASPWQRVAPDAWSECAAGWREGSFPLFEFGPGVARVMYRDASADERARERELATRAGEVSWLLGICELCELTRRECQCECVQCGTRRLSCACRDRDRRRITTWSPKSRANLVRTILSLDLAKILEAGRVPVMVTLTLPGRWLEVAPDAATAARKFDNFRRAWSDRWGAPVWLWKREFQRRGAPHWHLWLVPPTDELAEFREWLSATWTRCLEISDPSEEWLSLQAGTNVSQAEGARARDPKRLAIYFLKESLGGEGKAYQNEAPDEWAGESVGRFWGHSGMDMALRRIELTPWLAVRVWRILRNVRNSKNTTHEVRVARINSRTGEVRYRTVRRRARARGKAGWIAVNNGAHFASGLSRYLEQLHPPGEQPSE